MKKAKKTRSGLAPFLLSDNIPEASPYEKLNSEEFVKKLEMQWETLMTRKVEAVTGKGGYILFQNALRKEVGLPPLTQEKQDAIPDGIYKI